MAGKLTFLFALGAACLAAAVTGETELERLRAENARLKADANDGGRVARAVLETPQIRTKDGGMHVVVKEDQNVCFHQGAESDDSPCIFGMAAQIDTILADQETMAANITDVRDRLVTLFQTSLQGFMAATKKTNEKLDERLSSVEKEVDEGCGRHCYGGEYVKTPCSKTSKTVCVGCGTGKFSEGGFPRECTPCSKCTDRQFQTATCSTAADTGCTDCTTCPKGMFKKYKCTDKSTKQCVKQTVCGKGTWTAVVGSPWQDNQCKKCTACAKGSFAAKACTATADAVCAKCTATCKEGFALKTACSATADLVCEKVTIDAHGGNWYPWWWFDASKYKGSADTVPKGVTSVFEKQYGECKSTDPYCFGRLPPKASEFDSAILACSTKDCKSGTVYRWVFDPANIVSHAAFRAMHDHVQVLKGEVTHKAGWNPKVLLGKKSSYNQDSVQFYKANGVWTFQLDDDGCYCQTTLEMGKDLCGNGIQNRFGVDLQDTGCGRVSTKKSLFIYVRMNEPKQAAWVGKYGVGWTQWWSFTNRDGRQRDMLGREWGKGTFKAPDGCTYTKDGVKGVVLPTCNGQMPRNLNEKTTQLLAIDARGTVYRWKFNPGCATSKHVYNAFTKGWGGFNGRHLNGCPFTPEVLRGASPRAKQDSFLYKDCHGTKSFLLDDDSCYCYSSLEAGSRMCSGGCNSPSYGVDWIYDHHCQYPGSNSQTHMWMYYRDCSDKNVAC